MMEAIVTSRYQLRPPAPAQVLLSYIAMMDVDR